MLARLSGVGLADGETLRKYWQTTPVFLAQALDPAPLTPDTETLLEILNETELPARLITGNTDTGFTLAHGPFEPFKAPKTGSWTVLIQALEHLFPEYDALRASMTWLPAWRFEDVMLSWASVGGSVGPHYDHFSVFLVQLQGRRRWDIGPHATPETPLVPESPLRLVNTQPTETLIAEPGDVLYLPPGVIHHGVAVDADCLTLSIGFRAPDVGALLESLVEQVDDGVAWIRFDDRARHTTGPSAAITADDIARTRALLLDYLDQPGVLDRVLATRVTEPYLEQDPELLAQDSALAAVTTWRLDAGTRMAYTEAGFAIQGVWCDTPPSEALKELADTRMLTGARTDALSTTERNGLIVWIQAGWVVNGDLD
ncbi:MAG: cupin domain-containing protein [Litorivicinaceae bacterium]